MILPSRLPTLVKTSPALYIIGRLFQLRSGVKRVIDFLLHLGIASSSSVFLFYPFLYTLEIQHIDESFELLPRQVLREPIRRDFIRRKVFQLETPPPEFLTKPYVLNV